MTGELHLNADLLRFMLLGAWPDGLAGGLLINVLLALLTFAAGLLLALPLALLRIGAPGPLRMLATAFVETIRATPLLLLVFWAHFTLPLLTGSPASPLASATLGLTLYASAYLAEVVRAGLLSVPRGEIEAALASGLTRGQTHRYVLLPQGLRRMLPAASSFAVSLFKDTAVIYVVGVVDLLQAGLIAAERKPDHMLSLYLIMALGFFVISGLISLAGRQLDRRIGLARPLAS